MFVVNDGCGATDKEMLESIGCLKFSYYLVLPCQVVSAEIRVTPAIKLTLSTHLILALNSVNPKWISTENTIVQYCFPFLPTLGSALPLKSDKSACTIQSVENVSVSGKSSTQTTPKLGERTGISVDPRRYVITTSKTPNLDFKHGKKGKTCQFRRIFPSEYC